MDSIYSKIADLVAEIKQLHEPIPFTYACERCGRRDGLDAIVSNDLWKEISGRSDGGGVLCLWCMDDLADKYGVGGIVTLHFSGRALYGSSDAVNEILNEMLAVIERAKCGKLSKGRALKKLARLLDVALPALE